MKVSPGRVTWNFHLTYYQANVLEQKQWIGILLESPDVPGKHEYTVVTYYATKELYCQSVWDKKPSLQYYHSKNSNRRLGKNI